MDRPDRDGPGGADPAPAQDLAAARARMSFRLEPQPFALVGFPDPADAADLALLAEPPASLVRDASGVTLLVPARHVELLRARHPAARVEGPLDWIRFEAPMGWEVVGFLAEVTTALAAAGVPLGAVCGFDLDHLFLAQRHRAAALEVLGRLFPAGGGTAPFPFPRTGRA